MKGPRRGRKAKGPQGRRGQQKARQERRIAHAEDCAGRKADYCSCGLYFSEKETTHELD